MNENDLTFENQNDRKPSYCGGQTNNQLISASPNETSSVSRSIQRVEKNESTLFRLSQFQDEIAVEEPLEIRVVFAQQQKTVSITMRTPGNDLALAAGFLFSEGILRNPQQIKKISHCGPKNIGTGSSNIVKIELQDGVKLNLQRLERHFYTSSSCGVCGKTSLEALKTQLPADHNSQPSADQLRTVLNISSEIIMSLPNQLRTKQNLFDKTGGLHASALFDKNGCFQFVAEDVGRHNALDKLLGYFFLKNQLPLEHSILFLSGRASFELVQKAAMAGIKIIAAIGAPSSLAISLARETHTTLLGFVGEHKFNIYCGSERIDLANLKDNVAKNI